jgi:hypothetical protein
MIRRIAATGLALVMSIAVGRLDASSVMLSVKLVKTEAGRCDHPPRLEFATHGDSWSLVDKAHHRGENDWEVYFEIETDAAEPPLAEAFFVVPGVRAARVIVGKTDVPFTQDGDLVRFRLVDDRSRGPLMQVVYRGPRGGHPIYFIHNWEMRRAGRYAEDPYPALQIAAIKNYLLAAHEVFRVMGDVGPGDPKAFRGDLVLMDTEIAATRGHLDYPPHIHIMHYQFEDAADGRREWVSRLVPHIYMDDEGRVARNSHAVIAGRGQSGDLGPGDVCRFEDTFGNHVLDLIIADQGLLIRRADGAVWSLRPDPEHGAAHAVYGFRGDEPICHAQATDEPDRGVFVYQIDTLRDGKVVDTFRGGYRYDPFTARVISTD